MNADVANEYTKAAREAVDLARNSASTDVELRAALEDMAQDVILLVEAHARIMRILQREADPTFGPMEIDETGKVAVPMTDPLKLGMHFAGVFSKALDAGGAENYAEWTFNGTTESVVVTVQRAGKITPHGARVDAERSLKRAVDLLAAHGIQWDGPVNFEPATLGRVATVDSDTHWVRIDLSERPNVLVCNRCKTRQPLPNDAKGTVFKALTDGFINEHRSCQEGDGDVAQSLVRPR